MSAETSEVSLTVLQGERGAVHRLALGWTAALRVGHGVGVVIAAAEAGAQLQAPHVANHSRRIKGLLWREDVNRQMSDTDTALYVPAIQLLLSFLKC